MSPAIPAVRWPSSLDPPAARDLPRLYIYRKVTGHDTSRKGSVETVARFLLPSEESKPWVQGHRYVSAKNGSRAVHLLGTKDGPWSVYDRVLPDFDLQELDR